MIADDHPLFRDGLRRALAIEPEFQVVGEAEDGVQVLPLARRLKPDVLLLDLAMPLRNGLDALRELSRASLPMRTIVLAAVIEPAQVVEALQLGARGIMVKTSGAQLVVKSIHAVMAGQYWVGHGSVPDLVKALHDLTPPEAKGMPKRAFGLTQRELEIVGEIVAGCTNKDIAQRFSISEETVKRHLTNIFDKLGLSNRLELALFALKHRLVAGL